VNTVPLESMLRRSSVNSVASRPRLVSSYLIDFRGSCQQFPPFIVKHQSCPQALPDAIVSDVRHLPPPQIHPISSPLSLTSILCHRCLLNQYPYAIAEHQGYRPYSPLSWSSSRHIGVSESSEKWIDGDSYDDKPTPV
jgi:hypothetical protein